MNAAGVGQRDHARLHVVTPAVALAEFLEKARAHVFAEDHREQLERKAAVIGAAKGVEAHGHVRLLGLLREEFQPRGAVLAPGAQEARGPAARQPRQRRREQLDDAFVIDRPGHGDDGGGAGVVSAAKFHQLRAAETRDALDAAGERPAERVLRPHRLGEQLLRVLRGMIAIHHDLLADDLALALDLRRREDRLEIHVAEHVAQLGQVRRGGLGVIAGVVLGGERVEVSAEPFHGFGDPLRAAPLRPFEKQMLEKVRDAALIRALVPPADACPDAEAHAAHVRHFHRGDPRAIRETGETIGTLHSEIVTIRPGRPS